MAAPISLALLLSSLEITAVMNSATVLRRGLPPHATAAVAAAGSGLGGALRSADARVALADARVALGAEQRLHRIANRAVKCGLDLEAYECYSLAVDKSRSGRRRRLPSQNLTRLTDCRIWLGAAARQMRRSHSKWLEPAGPSGQGPWKRGDRMMAPRCLRCRCCGCCWACWGAAAARAACTGTTCWAACWAAAD